MSVFTLSCLVLAVLAVPRQAPAQTATLDTVDVQVVDGELVGIRGSGPPPRVRLENREDVLCMEARGNIGAALTNRRFLTFSSISSSWQETRLRRDDGSPYVQLAANLALCITNRRVLRASVGAMSETRLSSGETVLASDANEFVGAVVTNKRVIGFSDRSGQPAEERLRSGEKFESLSALATSVNVTTSKRSLTYSRSSSSWREQRY